MTNAIARTREAARDILERGHGLRLAIDARRRDVLVPPHVRRAHGSKLVLAIERDTSQLTLGPDAFEVEVVFDGIAAFCRAPWLAVYGLVDEATDARMAIEEHAPPEILSPELAAEEGFTCSFCGRDRRDVGTLVVAPQAGICERCTADAVHLLVRRGQSSALAADLARGAIDLSLRARREVLLSAAHLAGDDLAALTAVIDQTDPDDPETTLAILTRVPLAARPAQDRLYEAEMLLELGRLSEADEILRAVERQAPPLARACRVRLLRVELAGGVDPARARAIATLCRAEAREAEAEEGSALRPHEDTRVLVEALVFAGDGAEALSVVEEALARAPDDEVLRELHLRVLTALGDPRQRALREALLLRADPDGALARRLR